MSKSYKNIIPLLGSEKNLRKSIMKIVTNSLEPGEPKDYNNCTVFDLYQNFSNEEDISSFKKSYKDGISWGEAKEVLFNAINNELTPIREKYLGFVEDENLINDLLNDGAKKARILAKEKISKIREVIGIKRIS